MVPIVCSSSILIVVGPVRFGNSSFTSLILTVRTAVTDPLKVVALKQRQTAWVSL